MEKDMLKRIKLDKSFISNKDHAIIVSKETFSGDYVITPDVLVRLLWDVTRADDILMETVYKTLVELGPLVTHIRIFNPHIHDKIVMVFYADDYTNGIMEKKSKSIMINHCKSHLLLPKMFKYIENYKQRSRFKSNMIFVNQDHYDSVKLTMSSRSRDLLCPFKNSILLNKWVYFNNNVEMDYPESTIVRYEFVAKLLQCNKEGERK